MRADIPATPDTPAKTTPRNAAEADRVQRGVYSSNYAQTRDALHRVVVHVVARARQQSTGRFGLRVTPGGVGTPLFGPADTQVRLTSTHLLVESTPPGEARTRALALDGATLAGLADLAGVDLTVDLDVGHDTPALGEIDMALRVDSSDAAAFADALHLGALAIDRVVASRGPGAAVLQFWPEHLDAGVDVGTRGGRVNLGVSAGDAFHDHPYAYVGPWGTLRPGPSTYWNAPFGAILPVSLDDEAPDAVVSFMQEGLALLESGDSAPRRSTR